MYSAAHSSRQRNSRSGSSDLSIVATGLDINVRWVGFLFVLISKYDTMDKN